MDTTKETDGEKERKEGEREREREKDLNGARGSKKREVLLCANVVGPFSDDMRTQKQ